MFRKPAPSFVGLLLLALLLSLTIPRIYGQAPPLTINEILVGNAATNLDPDFYEYASWIEIYNNGSAAVDLQDYSLSYVDHGTETAVIWKVPSSVSVPAKGTVLFWADGKDKKGTHTSFKLDMRGSKITLLNPAQDVVDAVNYDMRDGKILLPDISYGRQEDGGSNWVYFDQPTPAAANTTPGFTTPTLAGTPTFSPPGGFYIGEQTVSLSTSEGAGSIRYTTDGSIPTPSSPLYTDPLTISSPTVIRARLFAPGKLDSQTASHTYLINADRHLPVISLATNPAHFFDDTIGIYVEGTNGIPGKCSPVPVNWNQSWERPASLEMFEPDGRRVVAQDVGVEIFGGCSRPFPRKSLEIKARRTYGDNDIDYQALPDKPIDSYKRLILRNSGNDNFSTQFRDALQQYLVKDTMDIDYQAYRPVVVYLNGAYWGIHNLRDKADEAFVEQNYGLDADSDFDMIEERYKILAGNAAAWNELYKFISTADMSVPSNYEYVNSQIDIREFMNYYMTEIYSKNKDWPVTNIRYWRAYNNGQWRWILYDLDFGFDPEEAGIDYLTYILTCSDCPELTRYQATVFRKLMENTAFRNDFVQRFASHINITYDPARVNAIIDQFKAGIEPEMPAQIARWNFPSSMTAWDKSIGYLRTFANLRPANVRGHLDTYLGSPGTADLTVNIIGQGAVLAAGVKVPGSGYSGPYFKTVPMTLQAKSEPGWLFARWQETGSRDPELTFSLSGNLTRTAVFKQATATVYFPLINRQE
jgi:hypothetical protein